MKRSFDRPDYCKDCMVSDLNVESIKLYADSHVGAEYLKLTCRHDDACKALYERVNCNAVEPEIVTTTGNILDRALETTRKLRKEINNNLDKLKGEIK